MQIRRVEMADETEQLDTAVLSTMDQLMEDFEKLPTYQDYQKWLNSKDR